MICFAEEHEVSNILEESLGIVSKELLGKCVVESGISLEVVSYSLSHEPFLLLENKKFVFNEKLKLVSFSKFSNGVVEEISLEDNDTKVFEDSAKILVSRESQKSFFPSEGVGINKIFLVMIVTPTSKDAFWVECPINLITRKDEIELEFCRKIQKLEGNMKLRGNQPENN